MKPAKLSETFPENLSKDNTDVRHTSRTSKPPTNTKRNTIVRNPESLNIDTESILTKERGTNKTLTANALFCVKLTLTKEMIIVSLRILC